jgi:hypothetical protein
VSEEPVREPSPRRPGDGAGWRWLQIAGAAALVAAGAAFYVALEHPLAFVPQHSQMREPGSALWLAFEEAWAVGGLLFGAAGLLLLLRARWLAQHPAVLAGAVSLCVAHVMLEYHGPWWSSRAWEGDAQLFHRMAEDWPWRPGGWFRYRLLAPWLARHIGPSWTHSASTTSSDFGYWRLALFSIAATGPALSLLLRDLRFGTAARHLGVLLYLCSFAVLYNSWSYAMPDPLAMLLLVLACRAIVRGKDLELAVWLLLGGLTKEVVLFVVPVRWLWARRHGLDVPQALRAGLVALPALAVFAWLRFRPGEAAEYAGFVTGNAWLFPWRHQPDNVARLYSPFAAGWALVALSLRKPDRWTVAAIGFAVPCFLSLLVTDAGRMLVYLTPFAIPAMLRAAGADERVSRRGLIALLLVCLSMRLWEPFAPLWKVPVLVRRPLALALAAICGCLAYRTTEESTPASSPASAA